MAPAGAPEAWLSACARGRRSPRGDGRADGRRPGERSGRAMSAGRQVGPPWLRAGHAAGVIPGHPSRVDRATRGRAVPGRCSRVRARRSRRSLDREDRAQVTDGGVRPCCRPRCQHPPVRSHRGHVSSEAETAPAWRLPPSVHLAQLAGERQVAQASGLDGRTDLGPDGRDLGRDRLVDFPPEEMRSSAETCARASRTATSPPARAVRRRRLAVAGQHPAQLVVLRAPRRGADAAAIRRSDLLARQLQQRRARSTTVSADRRMRTGGLRARPTPRSPLVQHGALNCWTMPWATTPSFDECGPDRQPGACTPPVGA